jgi:hypothetical protein
MDTKETASREAKPNTTNPLQDSGSQTSTVVTGPQGRQAGTASGQPLTDVAERAPEAKSDAEAVRAAAEGQKLQPEEHASALQFFLDARADAPQGVSTKTLELRVGERWFDWTIRPVDMDTMRTIRKRAMDTKQARRSGDVDENRVNLAMVVAGTVSPDLQDEARKAHRDGIGPPDPVQVLKMMMQDKPGYIAQIAGEIMSISGFDDEDVREAEQVEAGKGSS